MAFITGSANSIAELKTALINGLTANGFSQDGGVIYKGGLFIEPTIPTGEPEGENRMLRFLAGNSQAAGVLGEAAPIGPRIGAAKDTTWAWPVTYNLHIHSNPDEVYFIIRRDLNLYQFAAFGQGNVAGLPGSGNWVTCTYGDDDSVADGLAIHSTYGGVFGSVWTSSQSPFWGTNDPSNTVLHHGLDGIGWSEANWTSSSASNLNAAQTAWPHLDRSPNAWNGEAPLLAIQPCFLRPSGHTSIVGDLAHARYLRIDNYNPEDIIDLTPDFWMVYPFRKKDTAERDGGNNLFHTGTFGWAIRYDGPV